MRRVVWTRASEPAGVSDPSPHRGPKGGNSPPRADDPLGVVLFPFSPTCYIVGYAAMQNLNTSHTSRSCRTVL